MPEQLDLVDLLNYPETPGWRKPETSIEAAEAIARQVGRLRARVLAEVQAGEAKGWGGLTADEAAGRLDLPVLTVRPRVTELRAMERLFDSGLRRTNESGRRAIVWTTRRPSDAQVEKHKKTKYERRKGR